LFFYQSILRLLEMRWSWAFIAAAAISCCFLVLLDISFYSYRTALSNLAMFREIPKIDLMKAHFRKQDRVRRVMLSGQIDFLQYRSMCLAACRNSLPEENPSESSIHCRSDTLTARWLDYIHNCDLDERKCEIKVMGCRGWILA